MSQRQDVLDAFSQRRHGYHVERQAVEVARQQRLSEKRIPESFDYDSIGPLRHEAKEKLSRIRPRDLAQASRISGITPADMALLMVHLDAPTRSSSAPRRQGD